MSTQRLIESVSHTVIDNEYYPEIGTGLTSTSHQMEGRTIMSTQDRAVAKKEKVKQTLIKWGYNTGTSKDCDDLDAEEELIRELKGIMEENDDPEPPVAASEQLDVSASS